MHHEHLRDCIDACTRCHHLCAETLDYCLEKGHNKPAHIRLLQDCIEICQTSADFMLRGSDLHALTCRVCADVCQRCADDCRQYGDDQMNRCVDVCLECGRLCAEMAKAGAGRR